MTIVDGMEEVTDGRTKVSDDTFWRILEESHGLFGVAARKIGEHINGTFSRQAVHQRANADQDRLNALLASVGDRMEEVVHETAHNDDIDPALKYRAAMDWLKTKGKNRGYTTRQEITGAEGLPQRIEIVNNSGVDPVTSEDEIDDDIKPNV